MYMIQPVDVEDLLTRCCNCVTVLCVIFRKVACIYSSESTVWLE